MNNEIIVIAGFSGAGKDTIAKELSDKLGYKFVISHSTRPMRTHESEGNPYFFISNEDMLSMFANEEIIEAREYNSVYGKWFYALHKDQIKDNEKYVIVADLLGAEKLKHHYGKRVKSIFIDCSEPERKKRCQESRKDFDNDEWTRRYLDDSTKFNTDNIIKICEYVVYNDNLNETIRKIEDYTSGSICFTQLVPDFSKFNTLEPITQEEFREMLKDS